MLKPFIFPDHALLVPSHPYALSGDRKGIYDMSSEITQVLLHGEYADPATPPVCRQPRHLKEIEGGLFIRMRETQGLDHGYASVSWQHHLQPRLVDLDDLA